MDVMFGKDKDVEEAEPCLNEKKKKRLSFGYHAVKYYNIKRFINRRPITIFKARKRESVKEKYERESLLLTKTETSTISDDLKKFDLESNTVAKLKEILHDKPKLLNNLEDVIRIGKRNKKVRIKSTTDIIPQSIFTRNLHKSRRYVKQLKWCKKTEKNELVELGTQKHEENEKKRKVYSDIINDDEIFTNEELIKIKEWKDVMRLEGIEKQNKISLNTRKDYEWDEFLQYFVHSSRAKEDCQLSKSNYKTKETEDEQFARSETEERIISYLKRWFIRVSPPSTFDNSNKSPLRINKWTLVSYYMLKRKEDRLQVAVKFLKLAKGVYPNLQEEKVLTSLQPYTGLLSPDLLERKTEQTKTHEKKMIKKLRYFKKVLREVGELGKIFEGHATNDGSEETLKDPTLTIENEKRELNKKIKDMLIKNNLSMYNEFVESVPAPYDELLKRTVVSFMKYEAFISNHLVGEEYRDEVLIIIKEILKMVMHSIKWLVDVIFTKFDEQVDLFGHKLEETSIDGKENESVEKERQPNCLKHFLIKKKFVNLIRNIKYFVKTGQKDNNSSDIV